MYNLLFNFLFLIKNNNYLWIFFHRNLVEKKILILENLENEIWNIWKNIISWNINKKQNIQNYFMNNMENYFFSKIIKYNYLKNFNILNNFKTNFNFNLDKFNKNIKFLLDVNKKNNLYLIKIYFNKWYTQSIRYYGKKYIKRNDR